jgi:hypothetical protein
MVLSFMNISMKRLFLLFAFTANIGYAVRFHIFSADDLEIVVHCNGKNVYQVEYLNEEHTNEKRSKIQDNTKIVIPAYDCAYLETYSYEYMEPSTFSIGDSKHEFKLEDDPLRITHGRIEDIQLSYSRGPTFEGEDPWFSDSHPLSFFKGQVSNFYKISMWLITSYAEMSDYMFVFKRSPNCEISSFCERMAQVLLDGRKWGIRYAFVSH